MLLIYTIQKQNSGMYFDKNNNLNYLLDLFFV